MAMIKPLLVALVACFVYVFVYDPRIFLIDNYPRDAEKIQEVRRANDYLLEKAIYYMADKEAIDWEKKAIRKEFDVIGRNGSIPVTALSPKFKESDDLLPLIIYYHGGGMVFGKGEDALMYLLGEKSGAVVVGVDYRLAPENPFPQEYFVDHSKEFHVDTNRILLLGVSAGGLMTATTAALAVHGYGTEIPKLNTKLAGQVLIIPVLEYPGAFGMRDSYFDNAHMSLSALQMQWFWKMYMNGTLCSDYLCAPSLQTKDQLSKLPPTVVLSGSADVLGDEAKAYYERLVDAGVDAKHYEGKGTHVGAGLFDTVTKEKVIAEGLALLN